MPRGLALVALLLIGCDQGGEARSAPTQEPSLIAPEMAPSRRSDWQRFDCAGDPPTQLAIGQDALLLDGVRLEDDSELRRVLQAKSELSRQLGGAPVSIYVQVLEPRPSLVRLRDILAAVRTEGFDDIVLPED